MIWAETRSLNGRPWELHVFWNGRLIYKRWLRRGCGVLIDKFGPPTFSRDRDSSRTRNPANEIGRAPDGGEPGRW